MRGPGAVRAGGRHPRCSRCYGACACSIMVPSEMSRRLERSPRNCWSWRSTIDDAAARRRGTLALGVQLVLRRARAALAPTFRAVPRLLRSRTTIAPRLSLWLGNWRRSPCLCGCRLWLLGYPDQALERSQSGIGTRAESSSIPHTVRGLYWNAVLHSLRREHGRSWMSAGGRDEVGGGAWLRATGSRPADHARRGSWPQAGEAEAGLKQMPGRSRRLSGHRARSFKGHITWRCSPRCCGRGGRQEEGLEALQEA